MKFFFLSLLQDIHWCKLLRHCVDNGSYQGCSLPVLESHDHPEEEARYNNGPKIPQSCSSNVDKRVEKPIQPEQHRNKAIWVMKHQEHTLSSVTSVSKQLARAMITRERKLVGMASTSQPDGKKMVTE